MLDALPLPRLRARLAGFGHGPESPDFLARGLIECRQETARPVLAAARAGHHQVAHGERRRRREIVQMPVRHLGVPDHFAGKSVQRDQVGMVGGHEDAVARRGHAAIGAAHGGGRHAGGGRAAVMPDLRVPCLRPAHNTRWPTDTYMMPPTTTGVTCRRAAFGRVKIHFGPRRATFALVIWASVV